MRPIADIARQYRGLQGDMPPFGDVITLLNDRRRIAWEIRDILSDHYMTLKGRARQRLQKLANELDETAVDDWVCVHGHDRCDQMLPGPDCPYCEQRR